MIAGSLEMDRLMLDITRRSPTYGVEPKVISEDGMLYLTCPMCRPNYRFRERFDTLKDFNVHLNRIHGLTKLERLPDKKTPKKGGISCYTCKLVFDNRFDYVSHVRLDH